MTFALAVADGAWTFMGAMLVLLVGIIYAAYSRSGSGIDHHPYARRYGDAPGARRRPQISGREGIAAMSRRGTR